MSLTIRHVRGNLFVTYCDRTDFRRAGKSFEERHASASGKSEDVLDAQSLETLDE